MTAPAQVGPSPVGGGPAVFQDRDELLADVGDRIRAERRARGWSQTVLGERAGMTYKVVATIELGKGTLPLLHLADVCKALGMSISDLLSERWQMPTLPPRRRGVPGALSPRMAAVLRVAASGIPLTQVAKQLGMPRPVVSSRLSEAYRVLGVADLPRDERRAAAVRVAEARGLFDARCEVDAA
ncbi:helix-turn-helix domain-containing protein [Streptomyces sp. NPDC058092]|uniref:helix-turn-helix domain-containing protein n=1 Tax=Streptomyces sp. NPDC058092 TaxID=3346336 RepID=UPI0036EF6B3A